MRDRILGVFLGQLQEWPVNSGYGFDSRNSFACAADPWFPPAVSHTPLALRKLLHKRIKLAARTWRRTLRPHVAAQRSDERKNDKRK